MKLTVQRLKKLIREEMRRLNEGAATMALLIAYIKYLQNKELKLTRKQQDSEVPDVYNPELQKVAQGQRIATAVLFLHALAIIMGHMMENVMSDEMSYGNIENRAIKAFRAMDRSEAQSILDELGMGNLSAEEILSVDEAELMDILREYDPVGYYQENA